MKKHEIPTQHPGHQQASAKITAALGTLNYPAEKEKVVRKVGDWRVPVEGEEHTLADILNAMPNERFRDVADATNAVDHHWGRIADTLRGAQRTEQE